MKAAEAPSRGLWHPPLWLGFLWGFAEGTLFFIIPDIVLSWAALAGEMRSKNSRRHSPRGGGGRALPAHVGHVPTGSEPVGGGRRSLGADGDV